MKKFSINKQDKAICHFCLVCLYHWTQMVVLLMVNLHKVLFFMLQKLKISTTCLFHYTSVRDLHEAHVANQRYSPSTMADNPFSSVLPPSPPSAITPLNNNINKVPVQEKISKFGQELADVTPKLDMENTPDASGPLLSLCYHSILPPPTAAHSHSHASNAVSKTRKDNFFEEEILYSPNGQYSTDS